MNTKERIEVLKTARRILLWRVVYNCFNRKYKKDYFLCNILVEILYKRKGKVYSKSILNLFIPTFTAREAAKVTKIIIPYNYSISSACQFSWWKQKDFKSRLKFLNYLIKNLKHK